jgi:putative Holliday junction resolvase
VPETILAFDFGLRRIGVAVGQTVTGSASPLGVVVNEAGRIDVDAIAAHVREWQPDRLVVGLPLMPDGSDSDMLAPVRKFAKLLERFGLPVETTDERYTSTEAERLLKTARADGRRGRIDKATIDSAAAVLIAERFLAGDS